LFAATAMVPTLAHGAAVVAPGRSWSLTKMKWSFGPFVPGDQVAT
jgi:hypothetical protein